MRTSRLMPWGFSLCVAMLLALAGAAPLSAADQVVAGKVTVLTGTAQRAPAADGPWTALAQGASVFQGDQLKTTAASRLEITMQDGSLVRMGPDAVVELSQARINKVNPGKKSVSLKLMVGKLWAKVTSLVGSESSFEVTTENAVAGVRGTTFRVTRSKEGTDLRVYEGNVLISNKPVYQVKGATKANRVQVAGPQEIGKTQWEEMITKALEQVRVADNGDITKPAPFNAQEDAQDEWVAWNKERDAAAPQPPAKTQ